MNKKEFEIMFWGKLLWEDFSNELWQWIEKYAEEMCKKQREICAERVMYKGKISKVEARGMNADVLQDKCEEYCLNAPLATDK